MTAPLSGIRVLEVANWIAVPSAGAIMADLGATVIKVEPRRGDAMRDKLRKPALGKSHAEEHDYTFHVENRGKRSIAIDIERPEGQQLVHRLLDGVDIFTTNLLPERQRRYRLDPETVHGLNPTAVYASLTAYGHRGPKANDTGFDGIAFFARAGAAELMAEVGGPPAHFRPGQGDHPTGLNLLGGILAALRLRDQTGEGQVVEVSLSQTSAWTFAADLAPTLIDRKPIPRLNREQGDNPLNRMWCCKDDRWIYLYEQVPRGKWPPFCRAIGHPELADDPRFDKFSKRAMALDILNPIIKRAFASRTLDEWAQRLDAESITWHPITHLHEMLDEPYLRDNDVFVEVEHPVAGKFETLNTPFRIVGADVAVRGAAPDIGEHTAQLLEELGIPSAEAATLIEDGVAGPAPKQRR